MSDDKLVKGFNDGHLLEKHKPALAAKLFKSFAEKEYDYAVGFRSGVNAVRMDKSKIRTHRNYDHNRLSSGTRNKDKTKDRDDREMDRDER